MTDQNSQKSICDDCKVSKGYVAKDEWPHTAMIKLCDECGESKVTLPWRHFVKERP